MRSTPTAVVLNDFISWVFATAGRIWLVGVILCMAVFVLGSVLQFVDGVRVTCAHDVGTPGTSEYRQSYSTYTVRGFDALSDPEESIQARFGYYDVFDSTASSGVECYRASYQG